MPRLVTLAATQFAASPDHKQNADKAEELVRKAAAQGAQVILLQELFEGYYWCKEERVDFFEWAKPAEGNALIERFSKLANELQVVLPVPFFERFNNAHYNSVAVIDADGTNLGIYRKTHIPDSPGYFEKFYFNPGDTGFKVFNTRYGRLGIAICWDQWFPESARCLALQGAEYILYPTAIGSEPQDPSINSYPHWCRTMLGHAAANIMPVVASNRIGTERSGGTEITFYGGSFIASQQGEVVAQVGSHGNKDGNLDPNPDKVEGVVTAQFDLDKCWEDRIGWGVFRDRRPTMYGPMFTKDGKNPQRMQCTPGCTCAYCRCK